MTKAVFQAKKELYILYVYIYTCERKYKSKFILGSCFIFWRGAYGGRNFVADICHLATRGKNLKNRVGHFYLL